MFVDTAYFIFYKTNKMFGKRIDEHRDCFIFQGVGCGGLQLGFVRFWGVIDPVRYLQK